VAGYVWDYAEGMEFLRYFWDAVIALDENAANLDESRRFQLCCPERLRELFESAGLRDVTVDAIRIPTRFENFEDFWRPFEGGQGPAPSYVAKLSENQREELKKRLSMTLPFEESGFINLTAKAWTARGLK
jgi:hypothetical protein